MTTRTAREKAREAAATYRHQGKLHSSINLGDEQAIADAASDIWEPIVRGLLDWIVELDQEHDIAPQQELAFLCAKEALGDD